ncbi:MAG: beta-lactamase family protein [Gemmatimonadetes bacterium]|nr:beta-lactamase family protein [Gemmatimonadota bacterium]
MRARFWSLLALAGCARAPSADELAQRAADRVAAELWSPVRVAGTTPSPYRLVDRMARYKVPGVSIAVVDSGRLVWARGFGLAAADRPDSVTPSTRFQAASISKPVAATAMLRLVEQGVLNLDQDVNSYLTSWKVPENRFTSEHKVTLRRLASHSAGLTVHGFPGYRPGDSIPTVPEILDGRRPANTGPVRVDTVPGSRWRYSGGGTTVMQLVVMDVTKEPFEATAKRLVLDPAGMNNSGYDQPLPAALESVAAAGHGADGSVIPGRAHVYPELAAAGLWTTPTDLLKWAMAIAASRRNAEGGLLGRDMAREMLTKQKESSGLGPMLQGTRSAFRFSHGGSNEGFKAELLYFPETGQGAAVMANGEQGGDLISEILQGIAAVYQWPDFGPKEITVLAMDTAALDKVAGSYELKGEAFQFEFKISREGSRLTADLVGRGSQGELAFTALDTLISLDNGNVFATVRDAEGTVTAIAIGGLRMVRKERK